MGGTSVVAEWPISNPYGEELVTNGNFLVDENWTKSSGSTIDGGEAIFNTAATFTSLIYQSISVSNGHTYRIEFTITNYVSGSIRFAIGSTDDGSGNDVSYGANGTYTIDYTINDESFTPQITFYTWGAGAVMHLDNVSVKEVL
jgi:hypothetical protein